MEQLKERLAVFLGKQNTLNKPQGRKNSYFKMRKNDNSSPQTPLPPTQLPIKPIINKNQNIYIETNISVKLKGYVKIDTSDTFYESFLEIKYSVSSKLKK